MKTASQRQFKWFYCWWWVEGNASPDLRSGWVWGSCRPGGRCTSCFLQGDGGQRSASGWSRRAASLCCPTFKLHIDLPVEVLQVSAQLVAVAGFKLLLRTQRAGLPPCWRTEMDKPSGFSWESYSSSAFYKICLDLKKLASLKGQCHVKLIFFRFPSCQKVFPSAETNLEFYFRIE